MFSKTESGNEEMIHVNIHMIFFGAAFKESKSQPQGTHQETKCIL